MEQPALVPDAPTFEAKLDRAMDDAFLAQLMNAPSPGNRAERREHAREVRLGVKRLRAWAHGVKAKREVRAVRKTCRAARVARTSSAPL